MIKGPGSAPGSRKSHGGRPLEQLSHGNLTLGGWSRFFFSATTPTQLSFRRIANWFWGDEIKDALGVAWLPASHKPRGYGAGFSDTLRTEIGLFCLVAQEPTFAFSTQRIEPNRPTLPADFARSAHARGKRRIWRLVKIVATSGLISIQARRWIVNTPIISPQKPDGGQSWPTCPL